MLNIELARSIKRKVTYDLLSLLMDKFAKNTQGKKNIICIAHRWIKHDSFLLILSAVIDESKGNS